MSYMFFLTCIAALFITAPFSLHAAELHCDPLFQSSAGPQIQGIVLAGERSDIHSPGRKDLKGIEIIHLEVPGGAPLLEKAVEPFLGQTMSWENLLELKEEVSRFYRNQGRPEVVVEIPKQKVGRGVVQLLITEKTIGKITYSGSRWWSEKKISQAIDIREREPLDQNRIRNNVAWFNQNPFHHTKVDFFPAGERSKEMNIKIETKDRFPLRVYVIGDNSGNPPTGNERFSGGVAWGDAFFIDDLLTYQCTTSNLPEKYLSQSGNYLSFLPWKHSLNLFGNHTTAKPSIPDYRAMTMSNEGYFRYNIPFKPLYNNLKHALTLGFNLKYANSNLFILTSDTPVLNETAPISFSKIIVSGFVGGYSLSSQTKNHDLSLSCQFNWSPGKIFSHQSNANYEANRPFSRNHYVYGSLSFRDIYKLPLDFSLAGLLRVQAASRTLPFTEVFTIGGHSTVRGYNEVEFTADNGLIFNLEIRSPVLPLLHLYKKSIQDQLIFLAFCDFGAGQNYHANPTVGSEPKSLTTQYALGVGPGLRYLITPYLSFRCDYGFKLHTLQSSNSFEQELRSGFGKWHIGAMVSY